MSLDPGTRVRVANRSHEGHHRTPEYVKGKAGTVVRVYPSFENPETATYGGDGLPELRLYQVSFAEDEVWERTRGAGSDRLYVDLLEHWLEAAE